MKRKVTVTNSFADLQSSDDEKNDNEEEEPILNTKEHEEPYNRFMRKFLSLKKDSLSLYVLANIMNSAIQVPNKDRHLFEKNFKDYQETSYDEYQAIIETSAHCLDKYSDNELNDKIFQLISTINIQKDFSNVVKETLEKVTNKQPSGFGGLYLLSLILAKTHDTFLTRQYFNLTTQNHLENAIKYSPVICWLAYHSHASANTLISFFLPEILEHVSNIGPMTVYATHLINEAFLREQSNYSISSDNYAGILLICHQNHDVDFSFDEKIKSILNPLLPLSDHIKDPENLAPALLETFPFPYDPIVNIFKERISEDVFRNSLISSVDDSNLEGSALSYINAIMPSLPHTIVETFPPEIFQKANEKSVLSLKYVKLRHSSIRMLTIIVLVIATYFSFQKISV